MKLNENMDAYLGDGLYVSHDSYHVVLKANSLTEPTDTVALEPDVLLNFLRYIGEVLIRQQSIIEQQKIELNNKIEVKVHDSQKNTD